MFLGNYNKQRARTILELCSKLGVLVGFLRAGCDLGDYMIRIGVKDNRTCKFCGTQDENPEPLKSSCTAIAAIHGSYFGKAVVDESETHSLKPSKGLQFIKSLRLDGEIPTTYSTCKTACRLSDRSATSLLTLNSNASDYMTNNKASQG